MFFIRDKGYSSKITTPRMMLTLGCIAAIALVGCASQLPPLPPLPSQHAHTISKQIELTNQLEHLTRSAYKIGPGDVLRVSVEGQPKLTKEVMVAANGAFDYPLIGEVHARDLTMGELEHVLQRRLASDFLVKSKLKTSVVKYRTQHIYVLGAVRTAGVQVLESNGQEPNIMDLIARAGGLTDDAGWIALVLQQTPSDIHPHSSHTGAHGQGPVAMRLDLEKIMTGRSAPAIHLSSGDVIFIVERGHYFVVGGVRVPGQYRVERDTTVLKAVARAGGFTSYAAETRLSIWRYHVHQEKCGGDLCLRGHAIRNVDEPPRQYRANLHDVIQPGDVLVVPKSLF